MAACMFYADTFYSNCTFAAGTSACADHAMDTALRAVSILRDIPEIPC